MTQSRKTSIERWTLILAVIGATITFIVETARILKQGAEWYSGIMIAISNSSSVNETQTTAIKNHEDKITRMEYKLESQDSLIKEMDYKIFKIQNHVK